MSDQGRASAKREAARRARRLAQELRSAEDRALALQFADELDAEAGALERVEREHKAVQAPPPVTQMQMQAQQGPLLQDKDKKP